MLNVLYLAHDIAEPAVRRRVLMLESGGANVTLAGFRRQGRGSPERSLGAPIELGATSNGKFVQRLVSIGRSSLTIRSRLKHIARPDVIIARNLEMLALARRVVSMFGGEEIPIVYECLDIHRLVLRDDLVGRILRGVEGRLARGAKLLITSSPAFLRNYFERFGHVSLPVELVENKYLELDPAAEQPEPSQGPPWRIGWFGTLRCRRSLHMLGLVAETLDGRFEVDLRGRPALDAMPDFHEKLARTKNVAFHGAYRNPEDIGAIYGQVHFSWVIDFYEEGQNSEWLLPNRLYEGCRFGAVPIVMRGTETARFIERHGIGIVLDDATDEALLRAFAEVTTDRVAMLRRNVAALPRSLWMHDRADCSALVERLAHLGKVRLMASSESGDAMKVPG